MLYDEFGLIVGAERFFIVYECGRQSFALLVEFGLEKYDKN